MAASISNFSFARGLLLIGALAPALSGCASLAEGVTRGLAAAPKEKPPRPCEITGPAFEGLNAKIRRYERLAPFIPGSGASRQRVKVMMVHGIGTHPPGYSTRFQRNLTAALGLTLVGEQVKKIELRDPAGFGDETLGYLHVFRYFNEARTREMLFYEVSWSAITTPLKESLAYDTSGEFEYRRATFNHLVKAFLNDRISDPMIYLGDNHEKILASVRTSLCWMLIGDWDDIPREGAPACDGFELASVEDLEEDEFIFVTHSLGSRIVSDAFQSSAEHADERIKEKGLSAEERRQIEEIAVAVSRMRIRLFMFANQLPLLQLGLEKPSIVNQIDAYCSVDGAHHRDRLVSETLIVAFSDPNDALSYAIPPDFAKEQIDSRLCPKVVNVSVGVTDVVDVLGIGQVANPMTAHEGYDNDPRVLGLVVGGIGDENTAPIVAEECAWLRVVSD